MKILVMGGTLFVGRVFVEIALERGHELTLFNRGKRNPELYKDLDQIHGDRGVDLSGLAGRSWDAVLDTSGYYPRVVGMSAEALRDSVGRYVFVSSVSAYADYGAPNQNEDASLGKLSGPLVEEITEESYGPLKALCEQAVQETFADRATIVRPGLVVGPHDFSDRLAYWPIRMARDGDVIVPDMKESPVQFIDVRDLAGWCLSLLEREVKGVFNATGPAVPYRMEELLTACADGTTANLVWVDPAFLSEQGVTPWTEMPLAIDFDGSKTGLLQIDVSKAIGAGLTYRPLRETIRDTAAWAAARPSDYEWRAGLTAEREAELLSRYKARRQ